jgi:flavin-dependent dehydrogenase
MFPRDHVGESLLPFNYEYLKELGVLDEMNRRFYPKPGVRFLNSDGSSQTTWCFKRVIKGPEHVSWHVHRADFDDMLLKNAEKHGVEARQGAKVTQVDLTNPDEVKVQVQTKEGSSAHQARFLIDASGQHTLLAKIRNDKHAFEGLDRVAFSTHWVNSHFSDSLKEGTLQIIHLGNERSGWIWIIPIAEGRVSVGVALGADYTRKYRVEAQQRGEKDWHQGLYMQEIKSSNVAREVVENASQAMPLMINGDYSYFAKEKYGPNYAIIGDASAFLDPIFASGIFMGIKSASLVTGAIAHKLGAASNGVRTFEEAYHYIDGAYRMVEKLIRVFYNPLSISFAEVSEAAHHMHQKFEAAYTIPHFMLAGDFFENHERYIEFIDLLEDEDTLLKFRHRIHSEPFEMMDNMCMTSFAPEGQ